MIEANEEVFRTAVLESSFTKPANGEGGWYVFIKYRHGYGEAAMDVAMTEALTHGYNPYGRAMVGAPSSYGLRTSCVSFWFFEKKGVLG